METTNNTDSQNLMTANFRKECFQQSLHNQKFVLILAMLVSLLSYFIFTISAKIYVYTDNITVAVVTDGLYGDNNFCQYLHPFLCLLVKFLTPLIPTADMFTVVCHVFIFIEIFFLSYLAFSITADKPISEWKIENYITVIVSIVAVIFFSTVINLWNVNYSVQAASFVFSGIVLLFIGKRQNRRTAWIIWCVILVAMGFMLRYEAALLFVPYIALEIIVSLIRREKNVWKYSLPIIAVIIIILGSRVAFYSVEPYATAQKYNQYRTATEDYPMEMYGAYTGDFSDIEKTEYEAATEWVLADTDVITVDKLEKFADVGSTKVGFVSVRALLRKMWRSVTRTDFQLLLLFIFSLIVLVRNLICVKDRWLKIESILSVLGSFIILAYITWLGRALLRIWQSVILADLAILLICAYADKHKNSMVRCITNKSEKSLSNIGSLFYLFIGAVMWLGIGQYMARTELHAPYTALTARTGADDSVYEQTYSGDEDAIYIWPNWYATIPDYFSKIDKLPTKRVIEHNIPIGDWTYEQPYFTEFLERMNIRNPMKALIERPHTYLMEGYDSFVLEFLDVHYGDGTHKDETQNNNSVGQSFLLHEIGKVNGSKAYVIEKNEGGKVTDLK